MSIRLIVLKIVPIMILVFLLEELGNVGGDIALVNGTEAVADGLLGESMEDLTEPSRQVHIN